MKKHVNILCNYSYTVTIGAVGNPGYGSPEEAYSHNAEGIVTDIDATTPEEGLNDIVYNGEYMLAVDRSTLTFTPDEGTRYVRVFTDYSGGWQVRGIDWSGGETDWFIPGMNGTVSPNAAGASSIVEIWRLADNTTGTPRTATVILAAGNLTKRITVTETL